MLYRYLKKKYYDDFLQKGLLRISHINYYATEEVDKNRQDLEEGNAIRKYGLGTVLSPQECMTVLGLPYNKVEVGYGGKLIANRRLPEAFLLSTSRKHGLEEKFGENCLIIIDSKSFAQQIVNKLSEDFNHSFQCDQKEVEYTDRNYSQFLPYSENDYFMKDASFKPDQEYRFVFTNANHETPRSSNF